MDLFRGIFSSAVLGVIALVGFPSAAAGEKLWPRPPIVNEIEVACNMIDGQRYTVRVQSPKEGMELNSLQFESKNVLGGTAASISLSPQAFTASATAKIVGYLPYYKLQDQMFGIPAGVYDLTVTWPNRPPNGELVFRNLTVPATVGTNGRGAGCKFQ